MKSLLFISLFLVTNFFANAQTLVASYPFNGNADDATGNIANNGAVNGATLTADRFDNSNAAYYFDGTDDFIEGNADNLPTGDRTISLWFNADAGSILANTPATFTYGGGNCGSSFLTIINNVNNGKYQTSGHCNFNKNEHDYTTVPENNWYNWVVTISGNTIKSYINGVLINTTTNFNTLTEVSAKDFYIGTLINNSGIGRFNPSGAYYFKGKLDDIKVFQGALSDSQIFDNYTKDQTKPGSGNGLQLTRTGVRATDPWVNIGNGYDFGNEPFTYETWVKRDDLHTTLNNYGSALIVGDNNGSWGIGIVNNNTLFFTKVGVNAIYSTGKIEDLKWHHVAVVYNGTNIQFYLDGVAAGTSNYTSNFSGNGNYIIGARQSFGNANGDQTLNGMIDETRIWKNVALSQTEIRDWMCKKVTSAHPQFTKLFAYFKFDEDAGPIDGLGGNIGTFNNSPILKTSGAAIGDDSDHDYVNTIKSALISHTTGESFLVESTTGDPAGIQVYRVDQAPSNLTGHNGLDPFPTYYGVFQTGGTSSTYTGTYTYFGNNVGGAEANLRLYSRENNASTNWTENSALPDLMNDKIVLSGQSTEYILGSALTTLPLNLISFSGKNTESGNELNWLTANEIALSHFEIERSENAKTFEKIGEVKANGGPSEKVEYKFMDEKLQTKNHKLFYRLRMVDLDGKFKYSKIINIENRLQSELSLYPNPTSDYFSISGNEIFEKLQIVDVAGKLVKEFLPNSGNKYNLAGLVTGAYFVKIIGGNQLTNSKLIIK